MSKIDNITTEAKILAAAEVIFLRDGYSGSRMQDIADLAGMNKALLHYYFRSKDKLFEYIFDKKISLMFPKMEELFDENASFIEILSGFIENYIKLLMANPFLPLFVITTINKPDREDFLEKLPIFLKRRLIEFYQRDLALGKVRKHNPVQLIISVFGMCVFPFMAKPMLKKMSNMNDEQFQEFMNQRIPEVQGYIKLILEP
ncbi:TetR/AcrR family transcriptional regulator [Arcicella sp. LKC2W]|uniref:TetR/AcrR family transcriptional regulator n=1 Tax=Arcicella sp. LKC2W TaxID=2984198 RepID=UPI002B214E25|nr:TetR/AcrR family transcriptional regulator [Arcicella sp. LKC2W]MEA5457581.1 TetR/AcrR family transcriptional regulator [Arcicella sp. LKC2W]